MNLSERGSVDAETTLAEAPPHHHAELRLWLRLLTCTNLIEAEIRRRLREEFDFTLPRFDILAQLEKAPDGLVLGEISRRLMVSAGNITPIIDRLLETGYITREPAPNDRRIQVVRLTREGRRRFHRMAKAHGTWIGAFFEGLSRTERDGLMLLLGDLKSGLRSRTWGEKA